MHCTIFGWQFINSSRAY